MSKVYVALIADAVHSRALPAARRARLQSALRAALKDFNTRYRRFLAARFAVTLGDELQCLLTSAEPVWEIAHQLRFRFPEVEWVVACGRGPIATPLAATAPEIDGPCFHAARAAMERGKEQRLLLAFGGFGPRLEPLADYYSALYWGWTPRQRRAASPPPNSRSTAAQCRTWPGAWPGPSSRPGIRCSVRRSWRPGESPLPRPAARVHARRHLLAASGGRPAPRPGAAPRRSGHPDRYAGGRNVSREARRAPRC